MKIFIFVPLQHSFYAIRFLKIISPIFRCCVCWLVFGSIPSTFCNTLNFDEEVQCPQVALKGR